MSSASEAYEHRLSAKRRYNRSAKGRAAGRRYAQSEAGRRRQAKYAERRRAEHRARIDELKAAPCSDCEGQFPPCAMDFHHRDPATKSFGIGQAGLTSWPRITEEIEKCDLLCANCHRIREHVSQTDSDSLSRMIE